MVGVLGNCCFGSFHCCNAAASAADITLNEIGSGERNTRPLHVCCGLIQTRKLVVDDGANVERHCNLAVQLLAALCRAEASLQLECKTVVNRAEGLMEQVANKIHARKRVMGSGQLKDNLALQVLEGQRECKLSELFQGHDRMAQQLFGLLEIATTPMRFPERLHDFELPELVRWRRNLPTVRNGLQGDGGALEQLQGLVHVRGERASELAQVVQELHKVEANDLRATDGRHRQHVVILAFVRKFLDRSKLKRDGRILR
ncbi:hypothetical protein CAOG_009521 [Capsaspora owczarzaki ATCC 30864]|uniref:Uncharacterized protein n=1 Tax=Capsaspora owczarzaki (strain ATCC 30864) TaxID=595528 RepID=A0A0D2VLV2_CAPO3|nr:hypothetical protein CAOG_009521 [Capsaspora owczarzaki ATCC 30864]